MITSIHTIIALTLSLTYDQVFSQQTQCLTALKIILELVLRPDSGGTDTEF